MHRLSPHRRTASATERPDHQGGTGTATTGSQITAGGGTGHAPLPAPDESLRETTLETTADPGAETAPTDDPNCTVPRLTTAGGEPRAGGGLPAGAPTSPRPATKGGQQRAAERYRILGTLGMGGMGIVYRAEDTRLGRIVALKTIPGAMAAAPGAKERFLNEARAASALDHPNVCTIYEIEETPQGQLYLAMPCYDGETLKCRLKGGPLPVAKALRIAREAARGLAKAHRHGIVHCDIKPANLMLTADGPVKILDFGIARLVGQATGSSDSPGGTPRYRSPEQARGEQVGPESDIWALGLVLLEMLTGTLPRPAGPRPDPSRTTTGPNLLLPRPAGRRRDSSLAAMRPTLPLPRAAPPELHRILSRMLAPRPADRYPDAAALLSELEGLFERTGLISALPAKRSWRTRFATAVAAAGLIAAGASFMVFRAGRAREPVAGPPVHRPEPVLTRTQITDFPGKATYPSLAPDGRAVVYVRSIGGRSHIFRQAPSRSAEPIDLSARSPAGDTQPAFSPDGRWIAFRSERDGGGLFIMPAAGGPAHRVSTFGFNPAWSPDGREIACGTASIANPRIRTTDSEIYRIEIKTGLRRRLVAADAAQPSWSPDGSRIAYWGVAADSARRVIWTVPAAGGPATRAIGEEHLSWDPVWSPDGRSLYFASDRNGIMNLWRIAIDQRSGKVLGSPEAVTDSQQPAAMMSLSRDGRRIVFASDASHSTIERMGFDPATGRTASAPSAILEMTGVIAGCDAASDGRRLVCQLLTPREELFLVGTDGRGRQLLLGDEHKNRLPVFSPDGTRVAFYSDRGGKYDIWSIGIDGKGLRQETRLPFVHLGTPLWSPDGRAMVIEIAGHAARIDLSRPLAARSAQLLAPLDRDAGFVAHAWSPDGNWLAGARQPSAGVHDPGIWLYSFASRRYSRVASAGMGLVWLDDGRHLLFFRGDDGYICDIQSHQSRRALALPSEAHYTGVTMSLKGSTLYLPRIEDEGHIWLLEPFDSSVTNNSHRTTR